MSKPITVEKLLLDIRAHCLDCMGGQRSVVARCNSEKCRLWPYRLPPEDAGRVYLIDEDADTVTEGRQLSMMDGEVMTEP